MNNSMMSVIVRQVCSYEPVANVLNDTLKMLKEKNYTVVNVIETKVNKIPGCTDQGFIVLYRPNTESEEQS